MSEKRFTVRRDEKGAILIPNSILKDGEIIDEKETVDLLNEQQATNDYLEESNSRLQIQLGETLRLVDEQQATIQSLKDENEQLKKQIQIYEQLISNSYVGEEETLDGFVGKYVIWEDELQKYKEKIKKVIEDE